MVESLFVNDGYAVASGTAPLPICAVSTPHQTLASLEGVAKKMEMERLSLHMQRHMQRP